MSEDSARSGEPRNGGSTPENQNPHYTPAGSSQPGYQQGPQPTQSQGQAGYQPTEQIATPQQPQHGQQHAVPPYPGTQHATSQNPVPQPAVTPRRGRTAMVAGAIALALVSGGIGGVVGAKSVSSQNGGVAVVNSLNAPKASTAAAVNAPAGSVQAVAAKVLPSVVQIEVVGARAQGEGSGI